MHEVKQLDYLLDTPDHPADPLFLPVIYGKIVAQAFNHRLQSYDLEQAMKGFLADQQPHYQWLRQHIPQLRLEPTPHDQSHRRLVSALSFSLHELVVDALVDGLIELFFYAERAPEVPHQKPGEKMPDILCQYPRLPLHIHNEQGKVLRLDDIPVTLIEVKTGKPGWRW